MQSPPEDRSTRRSPGPRAGAGRSRRPAGLALVAAGLTRMAVGLALALAGLGIASPGAALQPGSRCPDFELPWLDGGGPARSAELLAGRKFTVLVFWSRGCSHCTDVALGVDRLAGALDGTQARVIPILVGPDDPRQLRSLLKGEGIRTPHLWDAGGRVGAAYGLGLDHLRVVIADSTGTVQRDFDDSIPDLEGAIVPEIRSLAQAVRVRPAAAGDTGSPGKPGRADWPPRLEGRVRLQDAEGLQAEDRGLYGEPLEGGVLFLYRWDLSASWELAPGIEFTPWLRVSNEDAAVLTEGAEQLSSRWGSATLRWQPGRFTAMLGAFSTRISPLLLQRWDARDAPLSGGTTGCAVCGAGVTGVSARSLEVLGAPYTFEGLSLGGGGNWIRARTWGSVVRWEVERLRLSGVSVQDSLEARYRRHQIGATIDAGPPGREDPETGLPSPWGFRVGYLHVGDDPRSLPETCIRPSGEWRENGASLLARWAPGLGLSADAEHVWWRNRLVEAGVGAPGNPEPVFVKRCHAAQAWQAGIGGGWPVRRLLFRARLHRLRTDPEFDPLYASLTVEPNDEGWRLAGSAELLPRPGSGRPVLALTGFLRATRDVEPLFTRYGDEKRRTESLTLAARPLDRLLAEGHVVRTIVDNPHPAVPDERRIGYSLDLRWEGSSSLEPVLRLDALREKTMAAPPHTVWQGSLFVRVAG